MVDLNLVHSNAGGKSWKSQRLGSVIKAIVPRSVRGTFRRSSPRLYQFLLMLSVRWLKRKAPQLGEDVKSELNRFYLEDVNRISEIKELDLTSWLGR